jgi:hypothetical protein
MNRLDTWLDEECRLADEALTLYPERALGPADRERLRDAMRHSYRGQCLLLADRLEELWRALRRAFGQP